MKITIELSEEQENAVTIKSLKQAKKDLCFPSGRLMFAGDAELNKALRVVIGHYTPVVKRKKRTSE